MIRVVLDTNIVVSATLRAGELPEAVFNLAIDCVIQLCVSEPMLAEYEEVLGRARLAILPGKVATALARIREKSSLVTNTVNVDPAVCPNDPDDVIFLECAETAAAELSRYRQLQTLPRRVEEDPHRYPREFVEIIANTQGGEAA